jgi:hypothetical protein
VAPPLGAWLWPVRVVRSGTGVNSQSFTDGTYVSMWSSIDFLNCLLY